MVNAIRKTGQEVERMAFANRIKFIAETEYMWDGVKDDKGRFLLQRLGETGRQYNLNIWANKVKWEIETECNPDDIFIIDDWRYVNEAEVFENDDRYNVIKINIVRAGSKPLKIFLNSTPRPLTPPVTISLGIIKKLYPAPAIATPNVINNQSL